MALLKEEFTRLDDDVDLDRDRVLVERCQAGDSGAFGNLYARYYERLLRFCLRRLNDRHEAEDAAQEAFARAWKALPKFAGERRFYPWLTVIAGNICTDMLRRRSRSTPTDDLELSAQQPLGSNAAETSEEMILAAVDGELVNKALGRLSVRHQHVLAMREGSGWTYQQIADHEGVEIGTIETLLWRARQALKREFTVLSESKGVLGGFIAAGALLRRGLMRVAHRGSELQQGGNGFGLRNAMAGMAFTGAAVAAALITPHALSGPSVAGASGSSTALGAAPSNLASPNGFASAFAPAGSAGGAAGAAGAAANGSTTGDTTTLGSALGAAGLSGSGGSTGTKDGGLSGVTGSGGLSGALGNGTSQAVGGAVNGVAAAAGSTVGGLTQAAGTAVNGLSTTASNLLGTVTNGLSNTVSGTGLGSALPALPTNPPAAPTTTSTTTVVGGVVNGVTNPVKTLLGGL